MVSGTKASSSSSESKSSSSIILKTCQIKVGVKKYSADQLHYPKMPEIFTNHPTLSRAGIMSASTRLKEGAVLKENLPINLDFKIKYISAQSPKSCNQKQIAYTWHNQSPIR